MTISLTIKPGSDAVELAADVVAIAGFTGRNRDAVTEHLAELRALGVPTPSSTPCYYQAPPSVLVQSDAITVVSPDTSGEAECVLVRHAGEHYLTVGSDHTDRMAEAIDISLSKLACPKPIASTAWRLDDVGPHLDEIELRSWIADDDGEHLYQEGVLAEFLPLRTILADLPFRRPPGSIALFCGTLPAIGGIRPATAFRAELHDPITESTIEFGYDTVVADYLDL